MTFIIPLALGIMVGVSAWSVVRRIKSPDQPNQPPEPAPAATAVDPMAVIVMDRLDRIAGITPGMARRLNQAGILTYTDLAAQPPEHLYAILHTTSPQEGEDVRTTHIRDWIRQAQALANSLTHGAPPPAP